MPQKSSISRSSTLSSNPGTPSAPQSIVDSDDDIQAISSDGAGAAAEEKELDRLKEAWRSPVYQFFKKDVTVGHDKGRKYHLFKCAAAHCRNNGLHGVRRYQDSKDRAATSNLKSHAIRCFGEEVVAAAFGEQAAARQRDGSIFSLFARPGQAPVKVSHRAHTTLETRAHIVQWCAESNRALNIVSDRQFEILMKAGRPGTELPSVSTVSRDLKAAFERCKERIDSLLQKHNGLLHFTTDAWTSPNHRAFVAWTVHFHHEGNLLSLLLDIFEVPESHTGQTLAAGDALQKIRGLAFAIIHSSTRALPAWREACESNGLSARLLPRDVKTRWNSTYDMLDVALKYRVVVDDITGNKALKLRTYELDDDDWVILKDLLRVLKMFKDATLFFSKDTVETIAHVIPTMDRIDAMLKESMTEPLTPAVKHALKFARRIMNKYYSKTDLSNVYRIAMALHLQMKLKYFETHGWEQDWINTVKELVLDEFVKYDNQPKLLEGSSLTTADDLVDFGDIPMDIASEVSELEIYLSQPVEKVKDVITWWWDHRVVFPRLSLMALDYLSAPATSTAAERVFSQGRQLLAFTRNRLSPLSIRASMCLGDWSRKNLVTTDDIKAGLHGQHKRKREDDGTDAETEN